MGVIETVKEVGTLIQKLDNIDLVKRMLELQQQVQDLFNENRDLRDETRQLRERLAMREAMEPRGNAYWKGEDGPFCTCCFDAEGLAVRLIIRQGYQPQCPKCKTFAPDPNTPPPRPIVGGSLRSGFLDRDREPRF